jgi:hypothetical protein
MVTTSKDKVFISYRRADSAPFAGRIRDRLEEEFPGSLFRDVDSIEGGEQFEPLIKETIASCGIVLVLIGEKWLSIIRERSLQQTVDHVVEEIKSALLLQVKILPVLLEQTSIPASDSLPEEIRGLTASNAVTVRDASFQQDLQSFLPAIAEAIDRLPQSSVRTQLKPWVMGSAAMVAFEAVTNALGSMMVWSIVNLVVLIPSATMTLSFLKPVPPRFGVGMTIISHVGALVTLLVILEFKSMRSLGFSQDAIYFAVLILGWIVLNATLVAHINKKTVRATIAALRKSA